MSALAELKLQIMWNRLVAIVEEQAQTLIRTAFSNTVREAGDLSAGVFDLEAACSRRPSPARPATSTRWRPRSATS
jgi:hypothetical protein